MPAVVQVESSAGVLLFEGAFGDAALEEIGIQDKVEDVIAAGKATTRSIADTVRGVAHDLFAGIEDPATAQGQGRSLSEVVVEMGVTISGEGNVLVAKGSAEANLKVTLTWTVDS